MTMKRTLGSWVKRIGIWLARAALVGVIGVLVLLALLWRERNQSLELPIPSGAFAVGRAIYDWTDDAKLDTVAPVPGTKRELPGLIWDPSTAGQSVAMDDCGATLMPA